MRLVQTTKEERDRSRGGTTTSRKINSSPTSRALTQLKEASCNLLKQFNGSINMGHHGSYYVSFA
jgi:hypothetical protein